ncbi:MAG TPA: MFS transporter [Spongiibacteraceae bacterium]|nr:MFS transporter [Spongiibacteraceae bacterium]HCS28644.1 MFS transporter [Spongiibacteraceae bacterium]
MKPVNAYPPKAAANYVLVILVLAYILSFIDRNILALLVGPIREEYALTDFQFSILHGWAFTLFYIFLGLPIGWLADRFSRKWIITSGVFLWSLMTCLCGFAKSFTGLFVTRIGVGVGEAALSPPAYSLMSDYFEPSRLRYATAIYTAGITVGSGTSYMIGGWLYDKFYAMGGLQLPALGLDFKAWQLTFVAVGLPGLLVAALLLWVREPARQTTALDKHEGIELADVGAHLREHWQAYSGLILGMSMMAVIGYGMLTWLPEFLLRTYGMEKAEGGAWLGGIFIIGGTAGTFSGAVFAGLLEKLGYQDANMRLIGIVAAVLAVPAALAALMPSAGGALALFAIVTYLQYTHFGVGIAALQLITPNQMRAQVSALMLFSTNLFGLALGGSFVAFFTDFVYRSDAALNYSLASVAAIVYPLAAIAIFLGLKHYRRAQQVIAG